MASNAWERAQEAIARAAERDAAVITPDTAVSPFDASVTTIIPHAQAARRSRTPDPDVTQRLPHRPDGNGTAVPGRHAAPGAPGAGPDPEALTDRMGTPTVRTTHPGTSPFPANPFPGGPFPGGPGGAGGDASAHDETPAVAEPKRPWWRRLFGR